MISFFGRCFESGSGGMLRLAFSGDLWRSLAFSGVSGVLSLRSVLGFYCLYSHATQQQASLFSHITTPNLPALDVPSLLLALVLPSLCEVLLHVHS